MLFASDDSSVESFDNTFDGRYTDTSSYVVHTISSVLFPPGLGPPPEPPEKEEDDAVEDKPEIEDDPQVTNSHVGNPCGMSGTHTHACTYKQTHARVRTHTNALLCAHTQTHTRTHQQTNTHMCSRAHTYTHTHTTEAHTQTHTLSHTHVPTPLHTQVSSDDLSSCKDVAGALGKMDLDFSTVVR